MKFEIPIVEIERFQLRDIISVSGGEPEPTADSYTDDTSNFDFIIDVNCNYHDLRDNDNWESCL